MKLGADSRLARWAFFAEKACEEKPPPSQTSLCVLFWRSVLGLALNPICFVLQWRRVRVVAFALWVAWVAVSFVMAFVKYGWWFLAWIGASIVIVALMAVLMGVGMLALEKVNGSPRGHLVLDLVRAKKQRICPLVEIEQ